jgi:WD40 repeat protein
LNANYQCSSAVLLGTTAAANYPRYIEVSRDGSTAFCLTNNTIQIVNVNSRSIVCNIALTNSQWWSRAALSGDGKVLAVAMRDTGAYYLYSTNNGQLIRRILAPRPTVDVAVSNDGSKVLTTGADSMIRIYNVSDGTLISSLQGHSTSPIALSFTRDGKTLISGSLNQIIFWDWQSNTKLTTTQGLFFERPIFILPDGNVYYLSFGYQTVYIYNLTQNKLITTLHAPDYTYEGFLTSDGLTLVAGGNGEFLVYNLITGSLIQRIDCPGAIVARTLDDTQLITGDGHRNGPYRFFQMIFSWVGS